MLICPHCEEEITYLDYHVQVNEYGSAEVSRDANGMIRIEYHESRDTEWSDDPTYTCSSCSEDLLLYEIIYKEEEEEEEREEESPKTDTEQIAHTEMNETTFRITTEEINIQSNERFPNHLRSTIICEECFHVFPRDGTMENNIECPKCNKEIDFSEYTAKVELGFFNKKQKNKKCHKNSTSK